MLKDSLPSVVLSAARERGMEQDPDWLVVQEPLREPEEKSLELIPEPANDQ